VVIRWNLCSNKVKSKKSKFKSRALYFDFLLLNFDFEFFKQ
jgi:hypothetical protein